MRPIEIEYELKNYYPFGLAMAGISSKAAGSLENKHKYNGGNELQSGEFSDGSGLELYDAKHRMYDPQIGRFGQIDPLASMSENQSTYDFANNDPIRLNDPLGLRAGDSAHPVELGTVVVVAKKKDNTLSFYKADGLAQAAMARGITGDNVDLKRYGRNDRELMEYMFSAQRAKEREIYRDRSMENTYYAILASPILMVELGPTLIELGPEGLKTLKNAFDLAQKGAVELGDAYSETSLKILEKFPGLASKANQIFAPPQAKGIVGVGLGILKVILNHIKDNHSK